MIQSPRLLLCWLVTATVLGLASQEPAQSGNLAPTASEKSFDASAHSIAWPASQAWSYENDSDTFAALAEAKSYCLKSSIKRSMSLPSAAFRKRYRRVTPPDCDIYVFLRHTDFVPRSLRMPGVTFWKGLYQLLITDKHGKPLYSNAWFVRKPGDYTLKQTWDHLLDAVHEGEKKAAARAAEQAELSNLAAYERGQSALAALYPVPIVARVYPKLALVEDDYTGIFSSSVRRTAMTLLESGINVVAVCSEEFVLSSVSHKFKCISPASLFAPGLRDIPINGNTPLASMRNPDILLVLHERWKEKHDWADWAAGFFSAWNQAFSNDVFCESSGGQTECSGPGGSSLTVFCSTSGCSSVYDPGTLQVASKKSPGKIAFKDVAFWELQDPATGHVLAKTRPGKTSTTAALELWHRYEAKRTDKK